MQPRKVLHLGTAALGSSARTPGSTRCESPRKKGVESSSPLGGQDFLPQGGKKGMGYPEVYIPSVT